ncbi:MAG: 4-hydroxythreonine-4-phosphate dehydrogenase PdxA [Clostridiales bacterium]|jgi:4-hydroxythreonine-4-phosphate dehydrogenase|nr:4-hydroxythreonine-4-phosphate dehydrogenase PdxA [Clostridiales bacterium]
MRMLIGITMGDASGIGPELILRAFKEDSLEGDFIVIGDYKILDYCGRLLNIETPFNIIQDVSEYKDGMLNIYDMGLMDESMLEIGQISKTSGCAAYRYVERATEMALDGLIHAIVTLPMNKEATRLSFPDFTGHTELIAQVCDQDNYTMMLASDRLVVTHVSTHVSMQEAIAAVKKERVLKVIELTHNSLSPFIEKPKIAVAGLNPHAGEGGAFGREEIDEILPAVHSARELGINAVGPVSPDTVFLKAVNKEYHAVVCMYHDQGHIPIKLLDFEGGVNVTLGLKVIRTSVDHGTAFDIAYKGIASPESFVNANNFARQMLGLA